MLSVVAVPTVSQIVPLACRVDVRSTWYVRPALPPLKLILIPFGTLRMPVITNVPSLADKVGSTCWLPGSAVALSGWILTTIGLAAAGLTVMVLEVTPINPLELKRAIVNALGRYIDKKK